MSELSWKQYNISPVGVTKPWETCLTYLVNPQLPHDDVVHCGGHLLPRVVIVALLKHSMNSS